MAAHFATRPAVVPLKRGQWVFDAPLVWVDDQGVAHEVPTGFIMDGASIPQALWSVIGHPMTPEFVYPAGKHDYDCVAKREPHRVVHARFGEMLKAEKVGRIRRSLMTAAVQLFGPKWPDPENTE